MALTRRKVDEQLARLAEEEEDAEAKAGHASERLVRLVSVEHAVEVDYEEVRAAADDYAEAAQRLQRVLREQGRLRELLT